jgi:ADP-heptose:LPS heptosyltransferase
VPADELGPLFTLPDATFVNLQRGAEDALEQIKVKYGTRVLNYVDALDDVDELAALIKALGRMVTVDNSVAHLGGALGCKTWVMLAHSADWRWGRGQAGCPWYPSVSLLRQRSPGDWGGVLTAVAAAIADSIHTPC